MNLWRRRKGHQINRTIRMKNRKTKAGKKEKEAIRNKNRHKNKTTVRDKDPIVRKWENRV